eukprot:tig00020538_g10369.t1
MESLLGSTLHGKNGSVDTAKCAARSCAQSQALAGKKAVLLYFSAHWCPPCRGFTPELAKFYEQHHASKNFEIVFVSSDRDEKSWEEYYGEHPWIALPYAERELKNKLSKKFKVQGIPTLVVLDADGKVITSRGREMVSKDKAAKDFPWPQKSLLETLAPIKAVNNAGEEKTLGEAFKGKPFGVYFSAHWCPPCQGFTPKLAAAYKKLQADGKPFEVVYVSNDRSPAQFKEYFEKQPWLAVPFDENETREELGELFEVQGIPHLVLFDENGKQITDEGVGEVSSDAECARFPWKPLPVRDLDAAGNAINSEKCLVALVPAGKEEEAKKALLPVALEYIKQVEEGADDTVLFFVGSSGNLVEAVRRFTGVKDETAVLLVEVPTVYKAAEAAVTEAGVRAFVADAVAGKLTPLERPQPKGEDD